MPRMEDVFFLVVLVPEPELVLVRTEIDFVADRTMGDQPEIARRFHGNCRSHRNGYASLASSGNSGSVGFPGLDPSRILIEMTDYFLLRRVGRQHARRRWHRPRPCECAKPGTTWQHHSQSDGRQDAQGRAAREHSSTPFRGQIHVELALPLLNLFIAGIEVAHLVRSFS